MFTRRHISILTLLTYDDEQSCTAVPTDGDLIITIVCSARVWEDGDGVQKQECLHDTQTEMKRVG